jgi:hypothetical protein
VDAIGRFLIVFGVVVVIAGVVLTFSRHIPFLGRLPGDLLWQKGSLRVYFPVVTSLLLSVIATVILNLVLRR